MCIIAPPKKGAGMEQFFSFLGNHPILVGTFLLLLFLFFRNERARAGATVGTQELVRLVNKEKAIVLDVRERAEFIEGILWMR